MSEVVKLAERAQKASRKLASTSTKQRNEALLAMADRLVADQDVILEANAKDMEAGREEGLTASLLDRLELNPERLEEIVHAYRILGIIERGDFGRAR